MNRLTEDFRNYLRIERGMSPNTVASYVRDVEGLLKAYEGCLPADIGTAEVERYLSDRIREGLSKRSQARLLSSLRSFFNWCIEEGDLKDNPCDRIDAPKLGKYLPAVLSVEEVDAILESVDLKAPSGLRDRAILEVLYGCGLRVSECTGLLLSQSTRTRVMSMSSARATSSGSSPSGKWPPKPSETTCPPDPNRPPARTRTSFS
jgi:Site-specific recombinase XerD